MLFSGSVIKVNRRGKTQERWLMITGQSLPNESSPKAVCKLHIVTSCNVMVAMYTIKYFIQQSSGTMSGYVGMVL